MAIAEHDPGELYGRDKSILGMSHAQLHDFAATPGHKLPERAKKGSLRRAAERLKSR